MHKILLSIKWKDPFFTVFQETIWTFHFTIIIVTKQKDLTRIFLIPTFRSQFSFPKFQKTFHPNFKLKTTFSKLLENILLNL